MHEIRKIIGYLPMKIINGNVYWWSGLDQDWIKWSQGSMRFMPADEAKIAYHRVCAIDGDDHVFLGDNFGRAQKIAA